MPLRAGAQRVGAGAGGVGDRHPRRLVVRREAERDPAGLDVGDRRALDPLPDAGVSADVRGALAGAGVVGAAVVCPAAEPAATTPPVVAVVRMVRTCISLVSRPGRDPRRHGSAMAPRGGPPGGVGCRGAPHSWTPRRSIPAGAGPRNHPVVQCGPPRACLRSREPLRPATTECALQPAAGSRPGLGQVERGW